MVCYDQLFSPGILLLRLIHVVARIRASFLFVVQDYSLHGYSTFHLSFQRMMDTGLPQLFGYSECCYEHSCAELLMSICLHLSWAYTWSAIAGSYVVVLCITFWGTTRLLLKIVTLCTILLTMYEDSNILPSTCYCL